MTITYDQPMHKSGHTMRDARAFKAAGMNPANSQHREWVAVTCTVCGAATRHVSATCDAHYQPPARTILKDSLEDFVSISV
jgi:hypothetical protein